MTYDEGQQVKAAGAKWNNVDNVYCIEDHQKSDPAFAKYLPKEKQIMIDSDPNPDWGGTENEILGMMNSDTPKPSNQIKTNPTPEAKKDEIAPATSSPEILEPVIEGSTPTTSVSEKPTKRTRGQFVKPDNDQNKRSYVLNNESINELDRLAKYFKLNLSDTIQKLIKIGGQWIEENGKDAEIKMINNKNDQLMEAIEKTIAEQQREIDALKNALAKNSVPDVKNTNIQNDVEFNLMNKTITKMENEISALKTAMAKISVADIKNSNNSNLQINNDLAKKFKSFVKWTAESLEFLDDRTGPMEVYFKAKKEIYKPYITKYETNRNRGDIESIQLPDELAGGI